MAAVRQPAANRASTGRAQDQRVELAELIDRRPEPGAGVLVTLTQRCPLRCAHCSSSSTMDGSEPGAAALRDFVASFAGGPAPDVLMLTGGEPLLRPDLVADLAGTARRAGTRSAVLTGAFFARGGRTPERIRRAIDAVDHFSVSTDPFHEREVPLDDVLHLLREVLDRGVPASLHLTAAGPADPYVDAVVARVRRSLGQAVPMLVNTVRPVGRAAAWAGAGPVDAADGRVLPCAMAAWPVVAHDGAVVACCHQPVIDRRPVPDHLLLGDIARDGWPVVRQRALASPVLRMVRAVGPAHLYARFGAPDDPRAAAGYCAGCRHLGDRPDVVEAARRAGGGPVGALLDRAAADAQRAGGAVGFVRRYGSPRHADLVAPPADGR
jgi:pyruvate-formate lyase-activating enzyme